MPDTLPDRQASRSKPVWVLLKRKAAARRFGTDATSRTDSRCPAAWCSARTTEPTRVAVGA